MKKTNLQVRMTPEQKEQLKRMAHENYMNVSEFIHYLIEKEAKEQTNNG